MFIGPLDPKSPYKFDILSFKKTPDGYEAYYRTAEKVGVLGKKSVSDLVNDAEMMQSFPEHDRELIYQHLHLETIN